MNINNSIFSARINKQKNVLAYLSLAFKDFAYPVYLFGSYATGHFHGESDVDSAIIAPDAQAKNIYSQVCDKMTGLGMDYDILISTSIHRLASSITANLVGIYAPQTNNKSIGLSLLKSIANKDDSSTVLLENMLPDRLVHPYLAHRRQAGMTLIEIMVAMLVGLFLMGGVMQTFVGSKQTNRMLEALSRVQENGRYAMEFLTNDIRMAGYLGCNSGVSLINKPLCITPNNPVGCATPAEIGNTLAMPAPPDDFLFRFDRAIDGFESTAPNTWTPAINPAITSPLGGSDVITIRKADNLNFTVTAHAAPTADLTLDAPPNFSSCDLAVVTNCVTATLFTVSAVAGNTISHNVGGACPIGNASNDLGRTYGDGASQIFQVNTVSYYLRNNPNNQPALYRRTGTRTEELVEGIEQMQILYGVDRDPPLTPDGSADFYVPANQVGNMSRVVSIRISLVAVSLDNVTSQPINYIFNGDTLTPTDNRLRRVFTSTIAIRNRLS